MSEPKVTLQPKSVAVNHVAVDYDLHIPDSALLAYFVGQILPNTLKWARDEDKLVEATFRLADKLLVEYKKRTNKRSCICGESDCPDGVV